MKKVMLGTLLIAGIIAGTQFSILSDNQIGIPKTEAKVDSEIFEGSQSANAEGSKRVLLAGNVPCNPAKEVCED